MLHRRLRQTESELLALEQDQLRAALTTAPTPTPLVPPTGDRRGALHVEALGGLERARHSRGIGRSPMINRG
jgi:hypothetical protein